MTNTSRRLPGTGALLFIFLTSAWCSVSRSQWITHGTNQLNRRWAETETKISPQTAPQLKLQWAFKTNGDVSATPAVSGGVVYFPDKAGWLFAVNQSTGSTLWAKNFAADYGFPANTCARATPAIAAPSRLVIGTSIPAVLICVNLKNGGLLWKTVLDSSVASAKITGAATIVDKSVFVGVASDEEGAASSPTYPCCSFIGSLVRLQLKTGNIIWKTYTLPRGGQPGDKYSGAAIWGATPPVDTTLGLVFAATGNIYSRPKSVADCEARRPNQTGVPDPCVVPDNHQDSIVGLDLQSGKYKWYKALSAIDAFNDACLNEPGSPNFPNCPPQPGPDYDFGMSPLLLTIPDPRPGKKGASVKATITAQKSGAVYALEAATGAQLWVTQAGPGGGLGGAAWGIATDGDRVYIGIENSDQKPFVLSTKGVTVTSGAWVALNASTGAPVWYFANPNPSPNWSMLPSVANGVMFAASPDHAGHVYALNAATGVPLWQFTASVSIYGGISIDSGCIYFGVGYAGQFTTGGGPQHVYSFCV